MQHLLLELMDTYIYFQAHTLHILGFMSNYHSFKSMFKDSTPRANKAADP
jgi:hypothetical protein